MNTPHDPTSQQTGEPATLRRALSLPLLTLYGLGVTLGAGIYVLVGATAQLAGGYAPVAFLAAACVVSITAFSYIELATRYPVSAGAAAYVEAGFDLRYLTLLVGVLVALSGIISSSAVAIGAGSFLAGIIDLPLPVLIVLTVLVMGLLAIWGISESVTVAAIITLIELAGLLLVIGWGFMGPGEATGQPVALVPPLEPQAWAGIGAATVLAFFAFIGFEDMANVAEEVKDPLHTFPRAVMLVLAVTTALYVLTTLAVLSTVPLELLASSKVPLTLVFADAPAFVQTAFSWIAVLATVNGILIQIIMASRLVYGLADRGYLPRVFAHISARTRTPVVATLLIVAIVIVLSQTLPIEFLAERTSQTVLLIFVLVNLALIRIRRREAGVPRGDFFLVPIAVPVIGAIISLALFVLAFF